ncbi:MAG: amylo-alpha-1,6-glucosidase, partial [Planctomycetes bacterium]|nr:amylo-alpha-1,6-glucosidase [Planctomycetota bacterium]
MDAQAAIPKRLLRIERADCLWLERALRREWLETNGLGGYASMSILMCPTRRFHGLLVTPLRGETHRHLFLSRFEESLHGGEKSFPFSMARYPGVWNPPGHQAIESFELVPYPSAVYRIGPTGILRQVLMVRGAPTVLCRYRLLGERSGLELKLRPLFACRRADALTFENMGLNSRVERIRGGGIRFAPYPGLPAVSITLSSAEGRFDADPVWYRRLEYRADLTRGYDGHEDQFSPGWFTIPVELERDVVVAATIDAPIEDPLELWEAESARRRGALAAGEPGLRGRLQLAAEHFLYRSPAGRIGVMAGFPWATEHGRDTFVSLPGLTIARGAAEECGEALEGVLPFLRRGILPSVVGATPELSIYAAPDPALWFARAVRLYELAGGEPARARVRKRFHGALAEIATAFRAGSVHGIGVDDGGLLVTVPGDGALTWMDACSARGPVTPRGGAAVETNALWYFLLAYLEELERARGDRGREAEWRALKERAGETFLRRFWLEDLRFLADTWRD